MGVEIIKGNLFASNRQTLVNTINCVGVMGAGIALEFKFRQPAMFEKYQKLCATGELEVGKLWIHKPEKERYWILNFPTKKHWRNPSKLEYLQVGLSRFLETYQERGIESAAFPVLGASKGGLPEDQSLDVMSEYLSQCNIPIDIYRYDPEAEDDLYLNFKRALLDISQEELASQMGLRVNLVVKLQQAVNQPKIRSISQLASQKGIGMVSIEKSFQFLMSGTKNYQPHQPSLL